MAQPGNQRGMEQDMANAVRETMAEAMPENRERHPAGSAGLALAGTP